MVSLFRTTMRAHCTFCCIGPSSWSILPLNLWTILSQTTAQETCFNHVETHILYLLGCHIKHLCEVLKKGYTNNQILNIRLFLFLYSPFGVFILSFYGI